MRRQDLAAELSGVICRCTGYRNIVEAVAAVADSYRSGEEGSPSLPPPLNCAPRLLPGPVSTPLSSRTEQSDSDASSVPGADAAAGGHPDEITLPAGEPTAVVDLRREIPVPAPAVSAILADVHLLARCLPGAELTAELGDDWHQGRARVTWARSGCRSPASRRSPNRMTGASASSPKAATRPAARPRRISR